MPKETSKIKALIAFMIQEIMIFGVAGAAAQYVTSIHLPKTAIFLGVAVFYHLAVAGIGLSRWKKEQKYSISIGEL